MLELEYALPMEEAEPLEDGEPEIEIEIEMETEQELDADTPPAESAAKKRGADTALWERYFETRDQELRNEIVMQYVDLVKFIALRMRGTYKNYAQLDDVVNQGIIALIDAVEKYDGARGIKFETFASIKVKGAIIDHIRAQDWVPRRLRKLSVDLDNVSNQLYTELGRPPTHQEMAKEMNIPPEQLDRVMQQTYTFNLLSYEEVIWQKSSQLGTDYDLASDDIGDSPDRRLMETELRQQLAASIDSLNERERTVISLYYYEKLKLKEIAEVLGVSESRICQIHSASILKMKRNMHDYITL